MQRLADARAFYRALPTEFPLVLAFVEIAERALLLISNERLVRCLVRKLSSIYSKIELRIRPEIGGDLFGPEFVNTESVRLQGWIHCLKFAPHLFPGEAGLCPRRRAGKCRSEERGEKRQGRKEY
jgi:hypothetical protein